MELLTEMLDLAELHPRNNMNVCLMGGMGEILSMIFFHESPKVRKLACSIFTTIVTNNKEVQEFAAKAGAINLCVKFEQESTSAM